MDLIDYFTGDRPWRELYDFLDELPSWGHYKSALAMDEEWAQRILDAQAKGEEVAPAADPDRMTPLHYTPEVTYLALIADGVRLVRSAIIATAEGSEGEPPFDPLPRPETAIDRVRERRVLDELNELDRTIRGV